MKARVKATGEIVDIIRNSAFDKDVFYDSNGQKYNREELSFDVKEKSFPKDDPDYWTRLEHQYVGMAMQGLVTRGEVLGSSVQEIARDIAEISCEVARALVEKMKENEKAMH